MKDSYLFYKSKLNGEYRETFERIEMYVNAQGIDEPTKEERLLQPLDVFLSAQEDGKSVKKIVGGNVDGFCRTFCSDMGIKNKILRFFDTLKSFFILMLVFVVIDFMCADFSETDFFSVQGNYNFIGLAIALVLSVSIGEISNIIITNMMMKNKIINMQLLKVLWYGTSGLIFVLSIVLLIFVPFEYVSIPLWCIGATSVLFLFVYAVLNAGRKKRDVRKNIKMEEIMCSDMDVAFDREMVKIFNTKNQRNRKKNKPELSMEEFLQIQEKECEKGEKSLWFYYVLPLIICVALIIFTRFESFSDALVFIVIQLTVQYAVILMMRNLIKNSIKMRGNWIIAKRREIEKEESEK